MKDIKFRGRDIKTGKWIVGSLYCFDNPLPEGGIITEVIPLGTEGYYPQVDPETVGQYTTRNDKNGKEIFDGDIVRDEYGNVGKVFWEDAMLSWRINYNMGNVWLANEPQLEIIGNVYDNPGLLEERRRGRENETDDM